MVKGGFGVPHHPLPTTHAQTHTHPCRKNLRCRYLVCAAPPPPPPPPPPPSLTALMYGRGSTQSHSFLPSILSHLPLDWKVGVAVGRAATAQDTALRSCLGPALPLSPEGRPHCHDGTETDLNPFTVRYRGLTTMRGRGSRGH